MTRAEAIKRLETCDDCGDCLTCKAHDEAIEVVVNALKEQDAKWISVSEKLPECGRKVLVTDVRDGFVSTSELFARGKVDWWECEDTMRLQVGEITHWMPIPEVPKEDEECP